MLPRSLSSLQTSNSRLAIALRRSQNPDFREKRLKKWRNCEILVCFLKAHSRTGLAPGGKRNFSCLSLVGCI
jgi:hypothetical protein